MASSGSQTGWDPWTYRRDAGVSTGQMDLRTPSITSSTLDKMWLPPRIPWWGTSV